MFIHLILKNNKYRILDKMYNNVAQQIIIKLSNSAGSDWIFEITLYICIFAVHILFIIIIT